MFRTEFNIAESEFKINHSTPILSIGSCFADRIGEQLAQNKFGISANPFGIIYNSVTIFENLVRIQHQSNDFENAVFQHNGIWSNLLLHSSLSSIDKDQLLSNIAQLKSETKAKLNTSEVILFTFGSAHLYKHTKTQFDVANCHKLPAASFEKRLLTIDEIIESFVKFRQSLSHNPFIIFTVSPVRHIKDGMEQNHLSKSILRVAIAELQKLYPHSYYFPSFELITDDLRDYRFYKDDMLHPTAFAENYIWKKFEHTFFDAQTQSVVQKLEKLQISLAHKAFNPKSEQHQKFLKHLLNELQSMNTILPCSAEIEHIKQQLA